TAAEHLNFIRGLILRPKKVGAITPSSPALARAIAAQVDPHRHGPVLELGPGTGVVTQALVERGIAQERLIAIEYDPEFAEMVQKRFPRARVLQGDAFQFASLLEGTVDQPYAAIVSGLPLLNFPVETRRRLIESALERLQPGAPYVQFSYGTKPSIPPTERYSVKRGALVWKNLPPAHVWVYRSL
ncbi:MAG: methyltransferase domain-containing protein, partial [Alphaproteobacteria bacterium]|nr:methyltransferase domain-containing protein [Alphaproteobacteria bacterium]